MVQTIDAVMQVEPAMIIESKDAMQPLRFGHGVILKAARPRRKPKRSTIHASYRIRNKNIPKMIAPP
jgi:hypothetical protein